MKKYKILAAVALGVTALIVGWRTFGMARPQVVETYTVHSQSVEETVRCTGTVETAQEHKIYTDLSCKAEQVLVEVGCPVQKGDVLFTVDVADTVAMAANLGTKLVASDVSHEWTAPATGVVTAVNITEGKMTDASRPCVVIASLSQLQLSVSVRESQLRRVQVGQKVYISGDGFLRERYTGTLSYLAASASAANGMTQTETVVDATVTLDEGQADESLRLGLTAKAEVVVNALTDAVIVPYACIGQDDEGNEYVYVVRGTYAEKQVVTPLAELREGYAVQSGVVEGDVLVSDPSGLTRTRELVTTGETV